MQTLPLTQSSFCLSCSGNNSVCSNGNNSATLVLPLASSCGLLHPGELAVWYPHEFSAIGKMSYNDRSPKYEHRWADGVQIKKLIEVSTQKYVEYLMD
ncbi:MOB kinase activator-like 1B [Camellia lanceoleosa]|uniref:MOB kinase activator-like 1B n=1 Tax=Camellia lanceoleosa TaxID=1840588 RepID=A0ACC0IBF6_9ERIC|nr:MOB kinase activator-like 1B [Camellia lanceoleosa]